MSNDTNDLLSMLNDVANQKSSELEVQSPANSQASTATQPVHSSQNLQQAYLNLQKIMIYAAEKNASDIFIAPEFPPAVKINGKITPLSSKPFTAENTRETVLSTMTPKQIKQFQEELEINYAIKANADVRFRVNAYHEQGRMGMVMRKINTEIATLDELKLPDILRDLVLDRRGLIIVVGATGSGKSTTMAAMLDHRNRLQAGHIVTIEDPVEYVHRHQKSIVTQREVGMDTLSWHAALKSAMREAPDVVVIGEVRDEESMSRALELAQTGHLCLCTLHATNANQAVERVINFYEEARHAQVYMDLALNLKAIISQRLVVKKDGTGRAVAMDILLNNPAVQDLIFKGDIGGIKEIMNRAQEEGMQTFDQHLLRLYIDGTIDYEEALRNADSINDLRLSIKLWEEGQSKKTVFDRVNNLNLM